MSDSECVLIHTKEIELHRESRRLRIFGTVEPFLIQLEIVGLRGRCRWYETTRSNGRAIQYSLNGCSLVRNITQSLILQAVIRIFPSLHQRAASRFVDSSAVLRVYGLLLACF